MNIVVLNRSTLVTDADAAAMTVACASQLYWQAAPAWRMRYAPVSFGTAEPGSPSTYVIGIADDSDQAGALGWHTEGAGEKVYGRVFARPVLSNGGAVLRGGLTVASVLSHEVLETFVDPAVNLWASRGDGTAVALEVCDPVESDSYSVNGVTVSDFVTPAWFDGQAAPAHRKDWLGRLSDPFTMSPGGYWVQRSQGPAGQIMGSLVVSPGSALASWRADTKRDPLARTARRLGG